MNDFHATARVLGLVSVVAIVLTLSIATQRDRVNYASYEDLSTAQLDPGQQVHTKTTRLSDGSRGQIVNRNVVTVAVASGRFFDAEG